MLVLFLDDDMDRVKEFNQRTGAVILRVLTKEQFVSAIQNHKFDVIMLDHDLGYEQDSQGWNGQAAAKILTQNRSYLGDDTTVIIHSTNPVGVANMMLELQYADHLSVFVVHSAWSKVSMKDGRLVFVI